MSTASPGLPEYLTESRMESPCQECLLPKELVIMLLVVSGALAISFCLLLGYMCRFRFDSLANRCCRSCSRPPTPPPPRRSIAYAPPRETCWDDAPQTTFQKTLTVTLCDERSERLTNERIRLSICVKADALPTVRATGRQQRPGANVLSADPGATIGVERRIIDVTAEPSEIPNPDPAYVQPSPSSFSSLSTTQTFRYNSTAAMVTFPLEDPNSTNDQRRGRGSERSRSKSEGNDMT